MIQYKEYMFNKYSTSIYIQICNHIYADVMLLLICHYFYVYADIVSLSCN